MDISPDALRGILAALAEAQAYILHPSAVTPSATRRVATHRVPRYQFESLTTQLQTATKVASDALRAGSS